MVEGQTFEEGKEDELVRTKEYIELKLGKMKISKHSSGVQAYHKD